MCGAFCTACDRFGAPRYPFALGPSARPCARSTIFRLVSGRSPEPPPSSAFGHSACFAKSVAHVTAGRVRQFRRVSGLAPVRRPDSPGGFIRDPRRDTSLRDTASSSRAGLAANPPNRIGTPHSARHGPPAEMGFTSLAVFSPFAAQWRLSGHSAVGYFKANRPNGSCVHR